MNIKSAQCQPVAESVQHLDVSRCRALVAGFRCFWTCCTVCCEFVQQQIGVSGVWALLRSVVDLSNNLLLVVQLAVD